MSSVRAFTCFCGKINSLSLLRDYFPLANDNFQESYTVLFPSENFLLSRSIYLHRLDDIAMEITSKDLQNCIQSVCQKHSLVRFNQSSKVWNMFGTSLPFTITFGILFVFKIWQNGKYWLSVNL